MEKELEKLFVREVEVGVASLDMSTDEGVVSTRAVVQRTFAHDPENGQERELLLVYEPTSIAPIADALRTASGRATAAEP